jgi:hypothetical protein
MITDTIFLMWNCPECTQLKMNISFEKAFMDTASGKSGQILHIYYSFSNSGFKSLLEKFGITESDNAPLLKKASGEVITELAKIVEYMKLNY